MPMSVQDGDRHKPASSTIESATTRILVKGTNLVGADDPVARAMLDLLSSVTKQEDTMRRSSIYFAVLGLAIATRACATSGRPARTASTAPARRTSAYPMGPSGAPGELPPGVTSSYPSASPAMAPSSAPATGPCIGGVTPANTPCETAPQAR